MLESIDNAKKLQRMKHLMRRNILDVSWRKFFDILSYKAEWASKTMVKVNPSYTSQIQKYGKSLDRDYNASLNILDRELKHLRAGMVRIYAFGDCASTKIENGFGKHGC